MAIHKHSSRHLGQPGNMSHTGGLRKDRQAVQDEKSLHFASIRLRPQKKTISNSVSKKKKPK